MNCHNNGHYYAYILVITKQLTYDNKNSTKNIKFMHNRIMLSLKNHLKTNNSRSSFERLLSLK
jgi:hypothetical protein